jgi:hypothetical protein
VPVPGVEYSGAMWPVGLEGLFGSPFTASSVQPARHLLSPRRLLTAIEVPPALFTEHRVRSAEAMPSRALGQTPTQYGEGDAPAHQRLGVEST